MQRRQAVGFAIALGLAASPSAAAKPARACIEAHAQGQEERDAGRLLHASERFRACAVDTCPALIRKECTELGAEVESQVPSVVVIAEDAQGRPIAGAHANIDSERSVPSLDGTPLPLDPGAHRLEVVLADGRRQTVDVSVARAEKARQLKVTFAPPPTPPPRASSGNTLAYVIGGAGILALGAWGGFAWDGRHKQNDLEACAPRCTDRSAVDAMRRSYLIADVLLGVSAAALGTSAYLLISDGSKDDGQSGRAVVVGAQGRF